MAIYPKAVVKLLDKKFVRLTVVNRANLHTRGFKADIDTLYGAFNKPNVAFSHFYVRENGVVEQYVDTKYRAAADLEGNDATISIETWDNGKPNITPWNTKQVKGIIELLVWIHKTHGIKVKLATDSKIGESSKGISWHRLGCTGNYRDPDGTVATGILRGRNQLGGGMHYSEHLGKECPGTVRIQQIPTILAGVKKALKEEIEKASDKKPVTKPAPKPSTINKTTKSGKPILEYSTKARNDYYVYNLQLAFHRVFPKYDGWVGQPLKANNVYDKVTKAHVKEFQERVGLVPDGVVGSRTWAALASYKITPKKTK